MSELIYRMVSSTAAVFLGTFGAYYLIYRSGKKKTKGAFEKLGIDPKDVTYVTYISIGSNRFYPEAYQYDEQAQNSVENAKNKYRIREMKLGNLLKKSEKPNYKDFIVTMFKMMTPEERLDIIKEDKKNYYRSLHVFQEEPDIQLSSFSEEVSVS